MDFQKNKLKNSTLCSRKITIIMKKIYTLLKLTFLIAIIGGQFMFAQKQKVLWSIASEDKIGSQELLYRNSNPKTHLIYELDIQSLKAQLANVPSRESGVASNVVLSFPNAFGKLEAFEIYEASNMEPELQAQFPEIRAYLGRSLSNSSSTLRFSLSPEKGLSSMLLNEGKTVFIEPFTEDLARYIVFVNSKEDVSNSSFECLTDDSSVEELDFEELLNNNTMNRNADDGQLRTFRLALACTGEYAAFHGGTVAGALAAMNTTMTRVNGVYERDMAIHMNIIANNTSIIFLNAASDPYTNNNGAVMLDENQTTCNNIIGSANYDIGHVFSTGGGGIAQLNSPCTVTGKARGVTGSPAPVGDAFDIDYVAHEMGHQYGATHTQNNSCQISTVSSMEPGSASTIMGYAGICPPNVQSNSDDYFHAISILQMWNNVTAGNSQCGALSATGNTAPVANAGADFSIPKSTAFVLRGAATDVNAGNSLTYCWEQFDTEQATMPPVSTSSVGPAYRSLDPVASPDRYMPAFSTVLAGSLQSTWEVTPSVARTMDFVLTVRDNAPIGGSTSSDLMTVSVQDVTPFTVNQPSTWAPGSTQTVSWVVGQTNVAPINCQNVNILFSSNGGSSFTTLASNVPNDGAQSITVPNIPLTNNARVIVEAADNIFYAITDNFTISTSQDFSISPQDGSQSACNLDSAIFNFVYETANGFSENVTFSASGNPSGSTVTFNPTSLNTDGSFSMQVGNLLAVSNGNYTITVTGTSASLTRNTSVSLNVADGVCTSVANTTYDTSTTGVIFNTISNLNTGKPSGYSDYTSMVTDVNRESSYDLSVYANSDGNYQIITYAWVDWNQNCSFNDPGEQYDLGTSANVNNQLTVNSPLSITVPSDAALGNTTMRITTKYTDPDANQFPTSCENGHDAEVEDYTINVLASLSVEENEFLGFSLFPNPNNGEFTIKFKTISGQDQIGVQVSDIRGRTVFNNMYVVNGTEFNQTINLGQLQSGMYLVNVNDGQRKITKKIVVE